jgi:hypothetical protein
MIVGALGGALLAVIVELGRLQARVKKLEERK